MKIDNSKTLLEKTQLYLKSVPFVNTTESSGTSGNNELKFMQKHFS